MFKRTKGKWSWDFSHDPETFDKPGIFIDGDKTLLRVQIGDLQLMANAPKMYELLWEVADENSTTCSFSEQ